MGKKKHEVEILFMSSTKMFSFDHPHILAGQGSLGLEVLDQVPDVDAIVVPTGTFIRLKFTLYFFLYLLF